MKKRLLYLALLACMPALAQNYTTITANLMQADASGTLLGSGHIKFVSVNNNGQPIAFQVGGGGQAGISVVACTIVNGVITTKDSIVGGQAVTNPSGGTCKLANTALTNPLNVCFSTTWTDDAQGGAQVNGPGYGCVQPTGSTFNLDNFIPNMPALVVQTLVGGGGAGVVSFKGRTGTVVPAIGDYTYALITGLATVANTGSYLDLSNKPTIPAGQVNSDWNAVAGLAQILNKPTIPAAQVNSDWTAVSGLAQILNKPSIPSGTVTSVALTLPGDFSVAGSPVTGSGTFAVTRANQSPNLFLAGPSSGGAAAPAYRAIVAADVPTLNQSTTGNAATATALAVAGTHCTNQAPTGVDASGNALTCTTYTTPTNVQQQSVIYAADSGAANTLTVTLAPAPTIVTGSIVVLKVNTTNTGATTLNVNSGGAVAVKKGSGSVALVAGDLVAGQMARFVYDGTNYQLVSPSGVALATVATTGSASDLATGTLKETFPCILDTPTTADSGRCQFDKSYAYTIVRVYCNTTGAATAVPINLEQRTEAASDTATSGILTANLSCVPGGANTTSFSGTTSVPAHTPLAITIPSALTGAPTNIRVHVDVTRN